MSLTESCMLFVPIPMCIPFAVYDPTYGMVEYDLAINITCHRRVTADQLSNRGEIPLSATTVGFAEQ